MLFGMLNLGIMELLILGVMCGLPVIGGAIAVLVLTMNKKPPQGPDESGPD